MCERLSVLDRSEGVLEYPPSEPSEAFAIVVRDVVILSVAPMTVPLKFKSES
jgi:hypothetical protein